MRQGENTTVVSVTPIAVERDSRTFKQAASLARLGYRSIVVEGERSRLSPDGLPFELAQVQGAEPLEESSWRPPEPATPEAQPEAAPTRLGLLLLRARVWFRSREHLVRRQFDWNRRTYRSLPPASLYILHSFTQLPAVMTRCLLRRSARFAYDSHDVYFQILPGQSELGHGSWAKIERLGVRRSAGFTTVSDGLAGVLEERHGRRPVVIRNSHDLRLDEPAARDVRNAAGVSEDDFLLVSVGNDKGGMAVEAGLRALAELPDHVHLAFVGRGFDRYRARIAELGVEGRVHLVGAMPPTQLVSFIASADAAVLLYFPLTVNYVNALPNGFFQALAAGLPLLYPPKLREVAALVERHRFGIPIDAEDPDSIAAAVRRLVENPDELTGLRESARAARESESWEGEEARLADYVGSILDEP